MDTEFPYTNNAQTNSTTTKFLDGKLNYQSGKYNYFVEAFENTSDNLGSFHTSSRSNEIELTQSPIIYVPDAFTPNDDNINDDWNIHHVFVKDFSLKIYNQWGQLIYQSTDKNAHWRGEGITGIKEQSDVYVYIINYTGWDDSFHVSKGNLTLLR